MWQEWQSAWRLPSEWSSPLSMWSTSVAAAPHRRQMKRSRWSTRTRLEGQSGGRPALRGELAEVHPVFFAMT